MSERFVRVFKLPENIYSEGAPVIISAGALLKDNQTKKILAQLKIKSISNKPIKAVRVLITSFDTLGKQLEDKLKYEYLDLDVYRDCEFGQKVPIPLLDSSARAFSVVIDEVIFEDNSVWQYCGQEIKPLKEQKRLIDSLKDVELLVQYKKKYGEKCDYEMTEDRDLWRCSCSAINRQSEYICHECECSLDDLENVDWEKLTEEKGERLEKSKSKREKRTKLMLVIIFTCVAVTSISMLWRNYIKKRNVYNNAIALLQSEDKGKVDKGIKILAALEDFKDSKEQIYNVGIRLFDEGKYIEAYDHFRNLGNYKDSVEKAREASLYDIVIDHSLSNVVIDGMDERYNAKFLNGDEIKNIIIGSWFARSGDPHWLLTFNADGTIEQRDRLSDEWDLTNNDVKWTVENDELKIETIYAMDGSSNVENYKLLCISDDILILYNPDSEYIEFVYIRQNSDWADKCLKHYGIQ